MGFFTKIIAFMGIECCAVLIVLGGIIALLFISTAVYETGYDIVGDGLTADDIVITKFDTEYQILAKDFYYYGVSYDLSNVSRTLKGSEVRTYFLEGNNVVTDYSDNCNYSSFDIENNTGLGPDSFIHLISSVDTDKLINVTAVRIEIIKGEDCLFNQTKPFKMKFVER